MICCLVTSLFCRAGCERATIAELQASMGATSRPLLSARALEVAFVRHYSMAAMQQFGAEFLPNVDMNMPFDDFLELVGGYLLLHNAD